MSVEERAHHAHTTDQTPARSDDRSSDHNTAPLFKLDINKTETRQNKGITTTATGFYHEHFGMASPYIAKDIEQWISDMSDALVLDAMKRALEQNKPRWGYVKGILKSWQTKGITTVEEAKATDRKFQRSGRTSNRHSGKDEVIPAWFQERKQKQAVSDKSPIYSDAEREECERLLAKYGNKEMISS